MGDYEMDKLEERRKRRNEAKANIQRLYEDNVAHFDKSSEQYGQLMIAIENYASPAIWSVLRSSPFSTREDYEDVIQKGREEFVKNGEKIFTNYQKTVRGQKPGMFSDYARKIYRNKAIDYINKRYWEIKKDPVPKDVYIEEAFNNQIVSPEEELLGYYTRAVVNSDANPFHIILLCYSKILPVALGETKCNSADGWAWKHMTGKTMFCLSNLFITRFNSAVRIIRITFGKSYCDKLEGPFKDDKTGKSYEKMGEVILTSLYEQSSTKNWVARLNKKIMTAVVSEIMDAADSDEEVKRVLSATAAYTSGKYR